MLGKIHTKTNLNVTPHSRDPKTEGAQQGKLTKTMGNPRKLCHHYVNVCTHQTSRTIRAEEALMIALAKFEKFLER